MSDESQELSPHASEFVDEIHSAMPHAPKDQIPTLIESQMGFDLYEVDDDDAKEALEAYKAGDVDTFTDVLRRYDVPEHQIEQVVEYMTADPEDVPEVNDDGTIDESAVDTDFNEEGRRDIDYSDYDEPETDDSAPQSGGMSEEDVRRVANHAAREGVREELQNFAQQQQGGGGGGGGGNGQREQMLMKLASDYITSNQGPSVGEKIQERAMSEFLSKAFRPSPTEIMARQMEMKRMKELADEMENFKVEAEEAALGNSEAGTNGTSATVESSTPSSSNCMPRSIGISRCSTALVR